MGHDPLHHHPMGEQGAKLVADLELLSIRSMLLQLPHQGLLGTDRTLWVVAQHHLPASSHSYPASVPSNWHAHLHCSCTSWPRVQTKHLSTWTWTSSCRWVDEQHMHTGPRGGTQGHSQHGLTCQCDFSSRKTWCSQMGSQGKHAHLWQVQWCTGATQSQPFDCQFGQVVMPHCQQNFQLSGLSLTSMKKQKICTQVLCISTHLFWHAWPKWELEWNRLGQSHCFDVGSNNHSLQHGSLQLELPLPHSQLQWISPLHPSPVVCWQNGGLPKLTTPWSQRPLSHMTEQQGAWPTATLGWHKVQKPKGHWWDRYDTRSEMNFQ